MYTVFDVVVANAAPSFLIVAVSIVSTFSIVNLLYPSKVRVGTTSEGCCETAPTYTLLITNVFASLASSLYSPVSVTYTLLAVFVSYVFETNRRLDEVCVRFEIASLLYPSNVNVGPTSAEFCEGWDVTTLLRYANVSLV
jgi:hypothetical protein